MTRHTFVRRSLFAALAALSVATLWPSEALAQRAVRRPSGRSSVVVVARPSYYYYPRYYWPSYWPYYSYYGFYDPFFWGQYRYPPPYYGRYYYDDTGSAQIKVTPRNAQVYVDGYFAGIVDNFDGSLQRLNVDAGEHELQFYLEGYRPFSLKVLFVRGRTVKITHTMEPLGPGEAAPPKPVPDESRSQPYRGPATAARPRQMPPPGSRQGQPSDFGSLLLRVRPADADVLIDGEPWSAPQGEDQFVIELSEGPHRVEVRKNGFQTYTSTVRVRRGETVRLNVSLTRGDAIAGF